MIRFLALLSIVLLFCANTKSNAQCNPLRLNTSSDSGWKTCTASSSPNATRGVSSWLHYDLGQTHQLSESWLWNYNDYNDLESGVTQFAIDYLNPSGSWTELGIYDAVLADGTSTYSGQEGPDFEGIITSEVLITFLDNGGSQCYGIGEWKTSAVEAQISNIEESDDSENLNLYPSPTSDELTIELIHSDCNNCKVIIIDQLGRQSMWIPMDDPILTIDVTHLESGLYTACVNSESKVICEKFSVLTH